MLNLCAWELQVHHPPGSQNKLRPSPLSFFFLRLKLGTRLPCSILHQGFVRCESSQRTRGGWELANPPPCLSILRQEVIPQASGGFRDGKTVRLVHVFLDAESSCATTSDFVLQKNDVTNASPMPRVWNKRPVYQRSLLFTMKASLWFNQTQQVTLWQYVAVICSAPAVVDLHWLI